MEFSVGDKVVHPHHGPGRIVGIERWEAADGLKRYYVLEIPSQALTIHVPIRQVDEVGMRRAIPSSKLPRVLRTLSSRPRRLPDDYRERQEHVGAMLQTAQVMQLARVVRDLNWHRERAHLTKSDAELLKQGQDLLAAEMALVSGDDIPDSNRLIESTIMAALAGAAH
jgi:CarD family transcriptional regulator